MKKKPLKTEWTGLFDPYQAEHIAEAINGKVMRSTAGHPSNGLDAKPFEEYLLKPLDAYFREHGTSREKPNYQHIEHAEKLAMVLCDIVDRMKENRLRASDGEKFLGAWKDFVVYHTAVAVYDTLATRSAKGQDAALKQERKRKLPSNEKMKAEFDALCRTRDVAAARLALRRKYEDVASPQAINKAFRRAGIPAK